MNIAQLIWPHVQRHRQETLGLGFERLFKRLEQAYHKDRLDRCGVSVDELDEFCVRVLGRTPADVLGHETYWELCVYTGTCRNGHPRTPEDTYWYKGYHYCLACNREGMRKRYVPSRSAQSLRYDEEGECWRGHKLVGDNVYTDPRGYRQCKRCRRISSREYKRRKRAEEKVS